MGVMSLNEVQEFYFRGAATKPDNQGIITRTMSKPILNS